MSKRNLTNIEIQDILNSIEQNKSIPLVVSNSHIANIRKNLSAQLEKIQIYPEYINDLKQEIAKQYNISKINPGESVGIVAAQSIGERQTQMTLDTFHSAGSALKTVLAGVPRFSELLSATKNPKTVACTVYPSKQCTTLDEARNIGSKLRHVVLEHVVLDIFPGEDNPEWYYAFEEMYGTGYKISDNFVTITFDVSLLFQNRIELCDVVSRIETEYTDLKCIYSPTFLGRIDVYLDLANIESSSVSAYIDTTVIPQLLQLTINGIGSIDEVYYAQKDNEWIIETQGSSLKELYSMDSVDSVRTVSNDMWEIFNVLGVEAAREFLVSEFIDTISSDGTYVNNCHVNILVDVMLHTGSILSMSRYSQRKSKCGVLAKASFEESLDNFLKAALATETDNTTSVSSSIMIGKIASCGTGTFDIMVDMNKLLGTIKEEAFNDDEVYEL